MDAKILIGACVVKDGKTLLLQQAEKAHHPGKWGPPGGHREGNESLLKTCTREVEEETGLSIKINGIVECGIKEHSDDKISLLVLYHASPESNDIKLKDRHISNYAWATISDLKEDKYPLRDPLLKPALIRALEEKPLHL